MNILEYFIGKEGEEAKSIAATTFGRRETMSRVDGKLWPERIDVLISAFDAETSLFSVGTSAMRVFKGPEIPDGIGQDIKAAFEALREKMDGYIAGSIDASAMRAATKEAKARATEIRKALKKPKKQEPSGG